MPSWLLFGLGLWPVLAWPGEAGEYQLKAVFLYRFAQFVEWPVSDLQEDGELVLCVIGRDPFGRYLDAMEGKKVQQRGLVIRRLHESQSLKQCHMVFFGEMRAESMGQVINRASQVGVLTVADAKGFAAAGGMIQMVVVNDRIQFDINQAAAERVGLRLSAHLLKLARQVYSQNAD